MTGTFFYFAFGSNLLKERLLINNKTAVFKTVAKLENYHLKFAYKTSTWHGHAATIAESKDDVVWGVVYEMNTSNIDSLDKQEGVDKNIYRPIKVTVKSMNDVLYDCRTYQLLKRDFGEPSPQYKDIIVRGALASGIPNDYIKFLKSIPDNGNKNKVPIYDKILSLLEDSK
ncbi:gamma-glutamylcyclotransferase [Octopus bimaculoides]|uniref:gamma-glutamylcyclotransferase n=1 Tax=Octopus bimaculoides TaxID=37653 RepID=A0A0L8GA63_OCTBM|nr:gamma-glutamylcyclotransferase [Octopus bimaculoides]|eukprot:XP_014783098.1 PREDICTED: gamma-glutamylcyclotransferase-like [Octopus bimaculoides]